jgi:hypothetical protein
VNATSWKDIAGCTASNKEPERKQKPQANSVAPLHFSVPPKDKGEEAATLHLTVVKTPLLVDGTSTAPQFHFNHSSYRPVVISYVLTPTTTYRVTDDNTGIFQFRAH